MPEVNRCSSCGCPLLDLIGGLCARCATKLGRAVNTMGYTTWMVCPGCQQDTCKVSDGLCYSCRQEKAEMASDVHNSDNPPHNAGSATRAQHKPQFPCRNRSADAVRPICIAKSVDNGLVWVECTRSEPCGEAEPPWGRQAQKLYRCECKPECLHNYPHTLDAPESNFTWGCCGGKCKPCGWRDMVEYLRLHCE